MTTDMRRALAYLAERSDLSGYLYVHGNTRRALERRGFAVRIGSGLYGLTSLGIGALNR